MAPSPERKSADFLEVLRDIGQSVWLDSLQRRWLENGELEGLIQRREISGVTSNPTIFHQAISKSNDYDATICALAWTGWEAEKIFWELAVEDIRGACDLFMPLHEESGGGDGFVSLEEDPRIANNTEAAVAQAQQLWARVARPNLLVKIPATREGIPAIRRSIAAGVNINITLIFALSRYAEVMEAYLAGLEDRLEAGLPIDRISSVASFFVSRVDTKIDGWLPKDSPLRGKAAIANARLAYQAFLKTFSGQRWERLRGQGARVQRPLWASTSTKDPDYPDTLYVDNLVAPDTVNTMPRQTLSAAQDHGQQRADLLHDDGSASQLVQQLEAAGVSLDRATRELETEGVDAFAKSWEALMKVIDERRAGAVARVGPLEGAVVHRITHLQEGAVGKRIWTHDASLWSAEAAQQAEIRRRLSWLDLPKSAGMWLMEISDFARQVHEEGVNEFRLLGMGGSALAAEMFASVLGAAKHQLVVIDSTDPAEVRAAANAGGPRPLYLVSSKSGSTAEVLALLDYFWELAKGDGSRFIAVTDPGTGLEATARDRRFRHIFSADPNVGGRYSALSHFGLLPAALMGLDVPALLDGALQMRRQCGVDVPEPRSPGVTLGAALAEAALAGRDKLTFLADKSLSGLGAWLEQLIAESSGKLGNGIVPVDGEPTGAPGDYGPDRMFVYLRNEGELSSLAAGLRAAGHPVLEVSVADLRALGAEIYRWEMATAVASHILGVNAFDQPDVDETKTRTQALLRRFAEEKSLPMPTPVLSADGIDLRTNLDLHASGVADALLEFVDLHERGGYIALNAFLPRTASIQDALSELRVRIRRRTGCATTLGFGPRFLHSTGQLQKGGPDSGLFLQLTAEPAEDLRIGKRAITFGTLQRAQATSDYEVLTGRGRKVMWLHMPGVDTLDRIVESVP